LFELKKKKGKGKRKTKLNHFYSFFELN